MSVAVLSNAFPAQSASSLPEVRNLVKNRTAFVEEINRLFDASVACRENSLFSKFSKAWNEKKKTRFLIGAGMVAGAAFATATGAFAAAGAILATRSALSAVGGYLVTSTAFDFVASKVSKGAMSELLRKIDSATDRRELDSAVARVVEEFEERELGSALQAAKERAKKYQSVKKVASLTSAAVFSILWGTAVAEAAVSDARMREILQDVRADHPKQGYVTLEQVVRRTEGLANGVPLSESSKLLSGQGALSAYVADPSGPVARALADAGKLADGASVDSVARKLSEADIAKTIASLYDENASGGLVRVGEGISAPVTISTELPPPAPSVPAVPVVETVAPVSVPLPAYQPTLPVAVPVAETLIAPPSPKPETGFWNRALSIFSFAGLAATAVFISKRKKSEPTANTTHERMEPPKPALAKKPTPISSDPNNVFRQLSALNAPPPPKSKPRVVHPIDPEVAKVTDAFGISPEGWEKVPPEAVGLPPNPKPDQKPTVEVEPLEDFNFPILSEAVEVKVWTTPSDKKIPISSPISNPSDKPATPALKGRDMYAGEVSDIAEKVLGKVSHTNASSFGRAAVISALRELSESFGFVVESEHSYSHNHFYGSLTLKKMSHGGIFETKVTVNEFGDPELSFFWHDGEKVAFGRNVHLKTPRDFDGVEFLVETMNAEIRQSFREALLFRESEKQKGMRNLSTFEIPESDLKAIYSRLEAPESVKSGRSVGGHWFTSIYGLANGKLRLKHLRHPAAKGTSGGEQGFSGGYFSSGQNRSMSDFSEFEQETVFNVFTSIGKKEANLPRSFTGMCEEIEWFRRYGSEVGPSQKDLSDQVKIETIFKNYPDRQTACFAVANPIVAGESVSGIGKNGLVLRSNRLSSGGSGERDYVMTFWKVVRMTEEERRRRISLVAALSKPEAAELGILDESGEPRYLDRQITVRSGLTVGPDVFPVAVDPVAG